MQLFHSNARKALAKEKVARNSHRLLEENNKCQHRQDFKMKDMNIIMN
jgi:hypothetical protein